jgi:hypothetical protein
MPLPFHPDDPNLDTEIGRKGRERTEFPRRSISDDLAVTDAGVAVDGSERGA